MNDTTIHCIDIDFDNQDDIMEISQIHESMPSLWSPNYQLSNASVTRQATRFASFKNNQTVKILIA